MSGLSGPKAHEVRAGLGPDPASAGKLVLTPVQSGRSSRADKDADRQNYGFSGTPMWKIQQQLKKAADDAARAAAAAPHLQVPEGFSHHEGNLYWSEKRQVFWQQGTAKFFVYDKRAGVGHVEGSCCCSWLARGQANEVWVHITPISNCTDQCCAEGLGTYSCVDRQSNHSQWIDTGSCRGSGTSSACCIGRKGSITGQRWHQHCARLTWKFKSGIDASCCDI